MALRSIRPRALALVGRLAHGGWAGKLDIVAYHPQTEHLIHIEPSIDAHSWKKREERFEKKFRFGREYIYNDVFPWLASETPLEQVAILITSARKELCGATVVSIDEFMKNVKALLCSPELSDQGNNGQPR